MNADKLSKLQAQVRIGGKGTPRRKMKKTTKVSATGSTAVQNSPAGQFTEDKRVVTALKKFQLQGIPMIEEVNMFKGDGKIIHIKAPKVIASIPSNMFMISGNAQEKEMTELMPGILTQMGQESLNTLKALAEQYQKMSTAQGKEGEEAPELVDFEQVSKE